MSKQSSKSKRSATKRLRVAVVSGTRAEFGLLEPVLREIKKRRGFDLKLIVTGMHLLRRFGRTIDQIREAGWSVDAAVRMQTGQDNAADEAMAVGRGISGIARGLERLNCDIVVVLGDRIEAFAGACAAAVGRRVVAHIHGGDRAAGDVDESLRNAISRLAHVHLVASKDAGDRLRRMGEEPRRIHRVGAPGLDDIRLLRLAERKSRTRTDRWMANNLGPLAESPYAVLIQHPCGQKASQEAAGTRNIVTAVELCGLNGVAIYPNSDPGHQGIIQVLEKLPTDRWRVFSSLVRGDYLRLLSRAAVLVGNSSSGIIESASIGVNAINIGPRQEGRLRCGPNVLDSGPSTLAIARAIRQVHKQPRPRPGRSVYGDGRAAERIAKVLEGLVITPSLLQKRLTY